MRFLLVLSSFPDEYWIWSTSETTPAGWFAKDPNILRRVGHVLLQPAFGGQRSPRQIIMAEDCFQLLKIPVDRVAQVVVNSTEKHFGSMSWSSDHEL
jgi:hypothetical protein